MIDKWAMIDDQQARADAHDMINSFGVGAQLGQVQEEAAELVVSISHYLRGRPESEAEVLEEAGDLVVMLDQIRDIFGDEAMDEAIQTSRRKVRSKLGVWHER